MTLQALKTDVQSLDIIARRIIDLHTGRDGNKPRMAFREIAQLPDYKGVPPGTICAIAKGREPKDPQTRMILGLPALALAPVCLHCGEVHTTKRCTADAKPKQRVKHICENCAYWIHADGQAHGDCQSDGMMNMVGPHLWTTPGFGCILWKKRA